MQTKFSKTACLATIQLNILVKEQINITTPIISGQFYQIFQALSSEKYNKTIRPVYASIYHPFKVENTAKQQKCRELCVWHWY
jgi:hypothetical protein